MFGAKRIESGVPAFVAFAMAMLSFGPQAEAKYSGGTGEPNALFQIATAEDMIALSEMPDDYDKHFILTANIDLGLNLPSREVFDTAVTGSYTKDANSHFQRILFSGILHESGHNISNLTMIGVEYLSPFICMISGGRVQGTRQHTCQHNSFRRTGRYRLSGSEVCSCIEASIWQRVRL